MSVLMEPKWNVKIEKLLEKFENRHVLMEPKWNVKVGSKNSGRVPERY